MKAAVLLGPHDLQLVERPMPVPAAGTVVMKVKAVGICGSDGHAYHGKLATVQYPRVIGHEVVGEISAVGPGVTGFVVGDHAVLDPVVSCGECPACRKGRGNVCAQVKCMGVAAEGGCAEYVELPVKNVHKIPANISWRDAVLMEPYTVGAQIVAQGQVAAGDLMFIAGAGTIGLVVLQAAKRLGAKVIVSDPVENRLARAKTLNADVTINPTKVDVAQAVAEFTGGNGFDVGVDAVGMPALLEQLVEMASPTGRIVVIGFNPAAAQLPQLPITRKELEIHGSRMHAGKFPAVIDWVAKGEVQTAPLVSHEFRFEDIQAAFDLLDKSPETTCKVILTF
ncbi:MAG TPA: zinc-binding alcohol dehydrogenase family protein [Patescibacteria group bacterium]|nr:zinc-binding alcohol dehydrogenase family protein [Patescibacteria group bacterium]